ncbi:MAG: pyrophosphatase [Alphaproteobacteria bacterium]|jgi:NTP pyrophosphatase (non-canonical NTP hydrolase)|nr:pyrophosphatase [Alphaproteobacteria bacterium]
MTFDDYARWAASVPVPDDGHDGVLYLALALTGEAGEVCEVLKKSLRPGRSLDTERVADELGDVLWSWVRLCRALDIDPADVLAQSRAKIDEKRAR